MFFRFKESSVTYREIIVDPVPALHFIAVGGVGLQPFSRNALLQMVQFIETPGLETGRR